MPNFDDRLTRELERVARPADPAGAFEQVHRRLDRRTAARRWQAGALAVAVVALTTAGFVALSRTFGEDRRRTGGEQSLPASNGEIVFSAGSSDGFVHLYAMRPDGTSRRQITDFGTDDTAPAVSPDGRTIAFVHQLEEAPPAIATIPIDGGVVTWLTDPDLFVTDGPTWSPDGTQIAFAARHGAGQRIFVMDADGRDPRPITDDGVYWPSGPAWSPDGTRIAFSASPISGEDDPSVWDIYTVRPDGTGLVNVTDSPTVAADDSNPTWSPDGERIAFARTSPDGGAIVIRDLRTGTESAVTAGAFGDGSPAWSPDGRWIAFDRAGFDRAPRQHPAREDLWVIRPDGTGETRLTTDRGSDPTWQPLPSGSVSPEPTPTSEPTASPSPAPDPTRDPIEVGLGFRLCDWTRLHGIDLVGDGTRGIAWVGTRAAENGTCPGADRTRAVVAADLHGDGIADVWSPIDVCTFCAAWSATDLDANGAEELVVLLQGGSTPQYGFYHAVPEGLPRSAGIYPIVLEGPGAPRAGFPEGGRVSVWAGGDEGDSYAIRCEGYPDDPVLVVATRREPVDADGLEIHVTRLRLETSPDLADAHFVIVDSVAPDDADEDWGGTAEACGVTFNPSA